MAHDLAALLGPRGALARALPSFESRPQQVRMALDVAESLSSGRHLLIEAGTGIGKSIAYLLPAILWAARESPAPEDERRIVVSTHTRALQEQLARKDLPYLQRALEPEGITFRHALLMGSENYLCLQRLRETRLLQADLLETRGMATIEALEHHAGLATSGLRTEIPFAVPEPLWARVRRDRDICLGARGPFWEDCLYRRDLARAREAHVLIVNHALFFLDLKTGGRILPPHGAVILDEAHRVEEAVAAQFGFSVSDRSLARLLEDLGGRPTPRAAGKRRSPADAAAVPSTALRRLEEEAGSFFEEVLRLAESDPAESRAGGRPGPGPILLARVRRPGALHDRLRAPLREIEERLEERAAAVDKDTAPVLQSLAARARDLRERLSGFLEQRQADSVYWIERGRGRGPVTLRTAPVEVAPILRRQLFEERRTIVLTSATLAAAGSFAHLKRRLGVVSARETALGSPYDYRRQALLYLPAAMPDPGQSPDDYAEAVTGSCRSLLRASGGGAFILFTSYALLQRVHDALRDDPALGDLELFRHEPGLASPILEKFRLTRRGVLLGTLTFWQGVDVPGEALRLVILTRLPFEAPGHPVQEARSEAIRASGGDPFADDALPEAILTFRQGFGRLIRSRSDRGVVAVLDPRLRTRPYGAQFLESLPGCPQTESIEEAERFLRALS